MTDGVQVRRLEAISKRSPFTVALAQAIAAEPAVYRDAFLGAPSVLLTIEERDWLVERLSTALDLLAQWDAVMKARAPKTGALGQATERFLAGEE